MSVPFKLKAGARAVTLALALTASSFSAHAVLERVGPASNEPSIGGYPTWYQDTTGLALEFCDPKNTAEVEGGWCLLLAGDIPNAPEVFPTSFFDEHFYWAGGAIAQHATQSKAILVLAQEAAFAVGPPIPGDQMTFARIRVTLLPVPMTGTYRIIHPYGEESIFAEAGSKIFFTDDVGVACAQGKFDCALNGRLGPFLLPSAVPGGTEMPPLTASNPAPDTNPAHFGGGFQATPYPGTGKAYIADPAREGPVTGSPLPDFLDSSGALRNHNIFRIEGPVGSNLGGPGIDFLETTNFTLMGRVFTGPMPGKVDVARASYTRSATGQQVDVIANAFPTSVGRLPAQAVPAALPPQLTFFDAPCAGPLDAAGNVQPPYSAPAGATETQMFASGDNYWGQVQPAALPSAICVKDGSARDANGNVVPIFVPRAVSDEVVISQADYDPTARTLTVSASSSDSLVPPGLSVAFGGFSGALTAGQIVVPDVMAPPANVRVLSSAAGSDQRRVKTGLAAAGAPVPVPTDIPLATNDAYAFAEDAGPQLLAVLANDVNAAGGAVTVTFPPRLGTAVLNADGTVTYTANANVNGADAFTYAVTTASGTSNTGTVTLDIAPVNDAPVAVNNSASALVNVPVSINLLANDTDPDGAADVVAAVNVTQPTPAGATVSVAGGVATFNATAAGTYTFSYQAQDAAAATSLNTATVTVQVAGAETLSISRAEYVVSKGNLRAQGTVSPATAQAIKLEFVSSAGVVVGLAGNTATNAQGAWAIDTLVALPAGASRLRATSANGSVREGALALK